MKFRGIIFDLDGTLVDTLDDIAGSMNRVLISNGYPALPVNNYKMLIGRGLDNLVRQALPVEVRQQERVNACLTQMMADYNDNCLINTHLYSGIRDLIIELIQMEIKIAVFSNKAELLTIKIVDRLLGDIPFVRVMGARTDFPKKPDPAGALLISEQMQILPENMMYIGDTDVDMITAGRAGMHAVGVNWGFRSREELNENGARLILDQPGDLLKYL